MRAVGEVFVDLVGDHPDAVLQRPLADGDDLGLGVHAARGVVRGDEQDGLGALGAGLLELIDGHLEAGLLVGVDHLRDATREGDRLGVRGPVRRRADDLVTLVAQHGERSEHGVLAAVGHEDLAGVAGEPRIAQRLDRDGVLQLRQTTGRAVAMVLDVASGLHGGLDDVLGRREVGLTGAEADDVLPRSLQGLRFGVNGKGLGFSNCGNALGDTAHV